MARIANADEPRAEIEITDEMIDAAVSMLATFDPSTDDPVRVAEELLRASLAFVLRVPRYRTPPNLPHSAPDMILDTD